MAVRWENRAEWMDDLPQARAKFLEELRPRIEEADPGGIDQMRVAICTEFQKLFTGELDKVSVPWMAPGDWTDTPYQPIFDATGDEERAAWWLGVLVLDTAIRWHGWLIASRPEPGRAIEYRPDIRWLTGGWCALSSSTAATR